jgi:hypothetical protein
VFHLCQSVALKKLAEITSFYVCVGLTRIRHAHRFELGRDCGLDALRRRMKIDFVLAGGAADEGLERIAERKMLLGAPG